MPARRSATVHHPLFARFYARIADAADRSGVGEHRDEMLSGLTGRVVEVGCGPGTNFAHYPDTVTEVLAVEPESFLRDRAAEAAPSAGVPVRVVEGIAHDLPCPAGWADAAVASLVLCSVADPVDALTEMRRVVRPGGELRFYEHVGADTPKLARLQRRLDVAWPHLAGGCHLTRDTAAAIEAAGWEVRDIRRFEFRPCAMAAPVAPHILGRATNPA